MAEVSGRKQRALLKNCQNESRKALKTLPYALLYFFTPHKSQNWLNFLLNYSTSRKMVWILLPNIKKVKPLEIVKGKEGRWSRPKQSTRTDRKKRKSMRFGQRRLKFRTFSNSTLVEVSCQSVLRRKNSPAQGSDGTENGKERGGCGRD